MFIFRNKSEILILVYLERLLLLCVFEFQARVFTEEHSTGQIQYLCSSSGNRKHIFSVRSVRVLMRRKLWAYWRNQVWDHNNKTLPRPGHSWAVSRRSVTAENRIRVPRQPTFVYGEKSGFNIDVSPTTSVLACHLLRRQSSVLIPLSCGCWAHKGRGSTEMFSHPTTRIAK